MTPEHIVEKLSQILKIDLAYTQPEVGDGFVYIPTEQWLYTAQQAKSHPELSFAFLRNLTATDFPTESHIEVAIHLFSYIHNHAITLKTRLDRTQPLLRSLCTVWPAANWHEREAYDLLGVHFTEHPDLRRLLLPEDWIGHPLRKDYQQESHYQGIPTQVQGPAADSACHTPYIPQVNK